jgi:hypothetical protein
MNQSYISPFALAISLHISYGLFLKVWVLNLILVHVDNKMKSILIVSRKVNEMVVSVLMILITRRSTRRNGAGGFIISKYEASDSLVR